MRFGNLGNWARILLRKDSLYFEKACCSFALTRWPRNKPKKEPWGSAAPTKGTGGLGDLKCSRYFPREGPKKGYNIRYLEGRQQLWEVIPEALILMIQKRSANILYKKLHPLFFLSTAFIFTPLFMLWLRVFALELPNLKHLYTRLLLLVSTLTLQVSGLGVQLLKDHLEASN